MEVFTREELDDILYALNDWRSPVSNMKNYMKLREKIERLLEKIPEDANHDKL